MLPQIPACTITKKKQYSLQMEYLEMQMSGKKNNFTALKERRVGWPPLGPVTHQFSS